MEITISILITIFGVIFGALFSDDIKCFFAGLYSKLGNEPSGMDGIWIASFEYGTEKSNVKEYIEVIKIKTFMGQITASIIDDELNHPEIGDIDNRKKVRAHGKLYTDFLFTGIWYQPKKESSYHGAFQLNFNMDGMQMNGQWIGYSDTHKKYLSGKWTWKKRITNSIDKY